MSYITGTTGADTLPGTADADYITGLAGADTLQGFDGDDVLDGGASFDQMFGGNGNDIYYVDNTLDNVFESANAGTDTVYSTVNYTLTANVENLRLIGASGSGTGNASDNIIIGTDGNDNLTGGGGDDWLYGRGGNNGLNGGDGNDYLDAGSGAGSIFGGLGDDVYVINSAATLVNEINGDGFDTVRSGGTFVLGAGFEALILTGSANNEAGGNTLDNIIIGNTGDNVLAGGGGYDTIEGGRGADTLTGGDRSGVADHASDRFVYTSVLDSTVAAPDVIYGFEIGVDKIDLTALRTGASDQLHFGVTANGTNVLQVDLGGDGTIDAQIIVSRASSTPAYLSASDIYWDPQLLASTPGYATGTTGSETLIGTNTSDIIQGLGGDDTIYGGIGNDTLFGGDGGDLIYGETGSNLLYGEDGADVLYGGATNDTLDGGAGLDWMVGGTGDDIYFVDNSGDVALEGYNNGFDTVQSTASFTLADYVENLSLLGTADLAGGGSAYTNIIIGNSGANQIYGGGGADTIAGGGGADILTGGAYNGAADGMSDRFVYTAASDSTVAATDVLFGFEMGIDKIDLTAVHTGASDVLAYGVTPNGTDVVQVDLGGDGSVDLMIVVTASATTPTHLTAGDILW